MSRTLPDPISKRSRHSLGTGFSAVLLADSLLRDATVTLGAIAARTERIRIGSAGIPIWTRNAATRDDLIGTLLAGSWW